MLSTKFDSILIPFFTAIHYINCFSVAPPLPLARNETSCEPWVDMLARTIDICIYLQEQYLQEQRRLTYVTYEYIYTMHKSSSILKREA